jgi:hypothetical protein
MATRESVETRKKISRVVEAFPASGLTRIDARASSGSPQRTSSG